MIQLVNMMIYTSLLVISHSVTATAMDWDYVSPETVAALQSTRDQDTRQCSGQQVQWFCFNSTTNSYYCMHDYRISCSKNGPLLKFGHCVTYSEDSRLLSIAECPYMLTRLVHYNVTIPRYIQLPSNITELSDYMCGPLNRKGIVCSECADGFGPSMTYECSSCTDAWYGVPLFLFLQFVPITVFYLIILVFQIRVTSAPMTCFITYAQLVVMSIDTLSVHSPLIAMFADRGDLRFDNMMKILLTLYGILNLDFFRYVVPPFCVSSQIKSIHIAFLGYISVFYPILLIILTWVCVELHGCNFRPLVWLWRPFHRCFVKLRRGWDKKSDIIDVFATFFLLSYSKCLYQLALLLTTLYIGMYNVSEHFYVYKAYADPRITYGSADHLLFAIPAVLISVVFNILPTLLLILYPIRLFRSCLSKCHIDFIAINIFVEKVHGCYRNGLNGGCDMRSLSGLYFLLRIAAFLTSIWSRKVTKDFWFTKGIVFLITALIVLSLKPYQKAYINHMDTLLLVNLALLCYVMSSNLKFTMSIFGRILLLIPIAALIMTLLLNILPKKCKVITFISFKLRAIRALFTTNHEPAQSPTTDAPATPQEQQPLITPTSTEINYGV